MNAVNPPKNSQPTNGTRSKLIRAATGTFAANGYRGSSTRRIATKAGVNEVTLFRIFGTKRDLLASVIDSILERGLKKRSKNSKDDSVDFGFSRVDMRLLMLASLEDRGLVAKVVAEFEKRAVPIKKRAASSAASGKILQMMSPALLRVLGEAQTVAKKQYGN